MLTADEARDLEPGSGAGDGAGVNWGPTVNIQLPDAVEGGGASSGWESGQDGLLYMGVQFVSRGDRLTLLGQVCYRVISCPDSLSLSLFPPSCPCSSTSCAASYFLVSFLLFFVYLSEALSISPLSFRLVICLVLVLALPTCFCFSRAFYFIPLLSCKKKNVLQHCHAVSLFDYKPSGLPSILVFCRTTIQVFCRPS